METMITRVFGAMARISDVAWMPLSRGMLMSISTTSG